MKELSSVLDPFVTLPAAVRTASANGNTVDLANYAGNMVTFHANTITDGTFTPALQESADGATWNNVAAADMVGSFNPVTAAQSNTLQKAGYIGGLRYLRMALTVTGAPATGGNCSSTITCSDKRKQP